MTTGGARELRRPAINEHTAPVRMVPTFQIRPIQVLLPLLTPPHTPNKKPKRKEPTADGEGPSKRPRSD